MKKFILLFICWVVLCVGITTAANTLRVLEVDYSTLPTTGQYIKFDGTNWVPFTFAVPDPLEVDDLTVNSSAIIESLVVNSDTTLGGVATASRPLKVDVGKTIVSAKIDLSDATNDVTGTVDETNGGTGQSTITQGDLLYGSASNTIAKLAKNTSSTRYLSNTGTSNNPAWAQVDLSNGVTGTLPIANGGTAATSLSWTDVSGSITLTPSAGSITGSTITRAQTLSIGKIGFFYLECTFNLTTTAASYITVSNIGLTAPAYTQAISSGFPANDAGVFDQGQATVQTGTTGIRLSLTTRGTWDIAATQTHYFAGMMTFILN